MPIFEIKKEHYYHGMWRANIPNGDILAVMWREDKTWYFRYRYRWTKDNKIWDSADKKSVYEIKAPDRPGVQEHLYRTISELFGALESAKLIVDLVYYSCNGDGLAMIEVFKHADGCYIQECDVEEYNQMQSKREAI